MKLLLLLAALIVLPALAQDYPGKPIRMVVGFPPGGGTDVVARIIMPRYSELLGQSAQLDIAHAVAAVGLGKRRPAPPQAPELRPDLSVVAAVATIEHRARLGQRGLFAQEPARLGLESLLFARVLELQLPLHSRPAAARS